MLPLKMILVKGRVHLQPYSDLLASSELGIALLRPGGMVGQDMTVPSLTLARDNLKRS
jgi:hypothetical protein